MKNNNLNYEITVEKDFSHKKELCGTSKYFLLDYFPVNKRAIYVKKNIKISYI